MTLGSTGFQSPLFPAALLVGAAMLLLGRRLFWIFVGGTGFVLGALVSARLLNGRADWVFLAVAAGGGLLGALIAIRAQKLAVGLAGFLAAGYLAHLVTLQFTPDPAAWIGFAVGGVLGSLLLLALFDWTLAALSSLLGAALIAQYVPWPNPLPFVVFVFLLGVGMAVQSRSIGRGRPAAAPRGKTASA